MSSVPPKKSFMTAPDPPSIKESIASNTRNKRKADEKGDGVNDPEKELEAALVQSFLDFDIDNSMFEVNLADYISDLRGMEANVDRSDLGDNVMSANTITKDHVTRQNRTEVSFIKCLSEVCK